MRPGRVMIVDDSVVVRAVLREQIESQGHEVLEAEDGDIALARAREEPPDAILLDVEMPRMDGWAVLKAIRQDPLLAEIPVIFLSAHSRTEEVVQGLAMGAHDYLRKPFEPSELIARVTAALRVKELQDELRRRNAELDRLSRIDPLTGLFNRRHLVEQLLAVGSGSKRRQENFGVVMMDVDRFKRVNDTEGHAAGDAVLREVADRIREVVRTEDVAARWGGEEFIVLHAPADVANTRILAERLRAAMEERTVEIGEGRRIPITISAGFAVGADEDPESLIRRADEALYAAKEGGRNRVEEAPPEGAGERTESAGGAPQLEPG